MKKIKFVLPVLILTVAGIVMLGCPSDPSPTNQIDDYNMVFNAGKFDFFFETPKIENGKEYEVILTIEKCDEDFIGSKLGGKIGYLLDVDDETKEFVLSGWRNPTPDTVSSAKTYKWTFKAGEKYSDSVDPVSPATTPEDGRQFFHLGAQDSSWNDYDDDYNFRIKGGIEIKEKKTVTGWISEGTVTLGDDEENPGKGTLSADDTAKIRNMPEGSKIVISVVGAEVGASGSGSNEPGWGVGSIGGWVSNGEGINSIIISIPNETTAGDSVDFDCEIEISAINSVFPTGEISLNIWNGGITKAELFKPQY